MFQYPQVFSDNKEENKPARQAVKDVLLHLEQSVLSDSAYVASNHVTIADFMTMASLSLLELVSWDFVLWRRVTRWQASIRDLPYYAACNQGLEDWKVAIFVKESEERDKEEWERESTVDWEEGDS